MLKVDFGRTEIKGPEPHILTEFTILARNLRELLAEDESTEYADKQIEKCIKLSKMTPDEIDGELLASINKLGEMLASRFSDKNQEESSNSGPSTGNSAFDDFLKDIFAGGVENE